MSTIYKDKHWYVRHAVAENPNTPGGTLMLLSNDREIHVSREAISNPNNPRFK